MLRINKKKKSRYVRTIVTVLVVLGAIAGLGYVAWTRLNLQGIVNGASEAANQTKSKFAFSGAATWRQGPTSENSMALFGEKQADGTSICFTSIEFKPGTLAVATEIQRQEKLLVTMGNSITKEGIMKMTLRTPGGDRPYDLHQYAVTGKGDAKLMGGLELGYVQLADGYVKIDGHCETAGELVTTLPALRAYKLHN